MASAGQPALATLEDPLVDRLVWRALKRGCGAVIARTPRAAVDCNRAEDEVDPSVIDGARRGRVTARARGGLGIVPARTAAAWLSVAAARSRPGSSTSGSTRRTGPITTRSRSSWRLLLDRFGCALLLDCHSMPPPPDGVPPIVFGDCRGRTADAWVSARGASRSPALGFEAGLNDPFAGGHVIERHARPGARRPRAAARDRPPLLSRRQARASPAPGSTASRP